MTWLINGTLINKISTRHPEKNKILWRRNRKKYD